MTKIVKNEHELIRKLRQEIDEQKKQRKSKAVETWLPEINELLDDLANEWNYCDSDYEDEIRIEDEIYDDEEDEGEIFITKQGRKDISALLISSQLAPQRRERVRMPLNTQRVMEKSGLKDDETEKDETEKFKKRNKTILTISVGILGLACGLASGFAIHKFFFRR